MNYINFYHGGISSNFSLENIDVLRLSEKQQNSNNSYVGFYMYDEENRECAFDYALKESAKKNKDLCVLKLTLDSDLLVYEVPPFTITRLTKAELINLINNGYDLVAGKMLGKMEYVLLNKNKIISYEILELGEKYNNGIKR